MPSIADLEDDVVVTMGMFIATVFLMVVFPAGAKIIGIAYSIMVLGYFVTVGSKNIPEVQIYNRRAGREILIIPIFLMFGIWLMTSSFLSNFLGFGAINPVSLEIFQKMALFSNLPAQIAEIGRTAFVTAYGLIVPIAESMFFLSFVLVSWTKVFKLPIRWQPDNYKMWWVILLVGVTASLFHTVVRGYQDFALMNDIIFFSVSGALVFKYGRLLEALILHVLVNLPVSLIMVGVLKAGGVA